jgi:CheY-like chemotaxis protein/two-component sensor histidine kinase
MLERQVGHVARLVDDLLDMSRITRGKIELRKERIALAPIVSQAVEAVRGSYRSMNHELTVTMPPQPVYLDADPTRVAQVIGNLLNNAGKFSDKGGHVWLTVERADEQAVIRVRDNGIGIDAEQLPRIFEMFTQVDTSLERSRDGLGIGLTLVRGLVELHGGRVSARSEGIGRGSAFEVRLPAGVPAARPALNHHEPGTDRPVNRRVLIADDNRDGAESLALVMTVFGCEVRTAYDGASAVRAAESFGPEVVFLDLGMPGMDGFEAARRIRGLPGGHATVLIALTGWGQERDRQRTSEAGFDAHLVKPVDPLSMRSFLDKLPVPR